MLRQRVKALAFTLLALASPLVAHAEGGLNQPRSWRYVESRDAITDTLIRLMQVEALSFRLNDNPEFYDAIVAVGCADNQPLLVFAWGKKVAGKAGLVVQYRFEGQPGREVTAKYVRRTRQEANNAP